MSKQMNNSSQSFPFNWYAGRCIKSNYNYAIQKANY